MEAAVQNILIATSCAIAGALINSFFGKKKQNAEIEGMIVTNYQKILEDLRLEVGRLRDRIGEVEAKELLYRFDSCNCRVYIFATWYLSFTFCRI